MEKNPYVDNEVMQQTTHELAKADQIIQQHGNSQQPIANGHSDNIPNDTSLPSVKLNRDAIEFVPQSQQNGSTAQQNSGNNTNNDNSNYLVPNIPQVPPQAQNGHANSQIQQMTNNFNQFNINEYNNYQSHFDEMDMAAMEDGWHIGGGGNGGGNYDDEDEYEYYDPADEYHYGADYGNAYNGYSQHRNRYNNNNNFNNRNRNNNSNRGGYYGKGKHTKSQFDWGKKQEDVRLGVLGVPFDWDWSQGNPPKLTREDCFNLKKNHVLWMLDSQGVHWTYNKFDSIDGDNDILYFTTTQGHKISQPMSKLGQVTILAQPGQESAISNTTTIKKDITNSPPPRPTHLKGAEYDNLVGQFIAIERHSNFETFRVVRYNKETSYAELQGGSGDMARLRLDQFKHTIQHVANGKIMPGSKRLEIKPPTQAAVENAQKYDPYQTMSRQSSNASNDSNTSLDNNMNDTPFNDNTSMPPLNEQQKAEFRGKEKIELIERKHVINPYNLPKCNELKWSHGKLTDILTTRMHWNYYKNSLLKCLAVGSSDTKNANLDYNNLMVVSGFGLSFFWADIIAPEEVLDDFEDDIGDEKKFDENNNETTNNGNTNTNVDADADGNEDGDEDDLNAFTNPNSLLMEEHAKLLECDSQLIDILARVSKHSGYDFYTIPCKPALNPQKEQETIRHLENLIIRGLDCAVASLTHDSMGHSALIVGYCKKSDEYLKGDTDNTLETHYFFKIKKLVSLKDERKIDGNDDDNHVNDIEYETIDLMKQVNVIIMRNPEATKAENLIDKMKIGMIRDSLVEFSNQYRTGSKSVITDDGDEIGDLAGEPAINAIIREIHNSIDHRYYMLRKLSAANKNERNKNNAFLSNIDTIPESTDIEMEMDKYMKNDQLLGRKVIYALIRLHDSREAMYQFFDKLYSLDPQIDKVKGGLLLNKQDIQGLIKREQECLAQYGGSLFKNYVKCYNGKPLPLQIPEWTIETKLQICQLLEKNERMGKRNYVLL